MNQLANGTKMITPIEKHGDIWIKREDLARYGSVCGAKARTAYHLLLETKNKGYKGVTTAGSRKSPQINIVASLAADMGLKCVAHCPQGELSEELLLAKEKGCEIIQHKAGYNSVIIKRCKDYAIENDLFYVPFGMECQEAVKQTAMQVVDIPEGVKRIVIPCGSGMNLAGLLTGLESIDRYIPLLAIQVGADPIKILDKYAPVFWRETVTIIKSEYDYHKEVECEEWGITFDPIYEAKCIEYLQNKDLFWIVGLRQSCNK